MEKGQEKLKRNLSEKVMLPKNSKKGNNGGNDDRNVKKNRFLVTINILGSTGPIKFMVNEDDPVSTIIQTSLKNYAREGRLPVLSTDINSFALHGIAQSDALNLNETIGSVGGRSLVLCKKQMNQQMAEARSEMVSKKWGRNWKAWLNKCFGLTEPN